MKAQRSNIINGWICGECGTPYYDKPPAERCCTSIDPNIKDYQIEIRGRIRGTHKLFGIAEMYVENEYVVTSRYDVIASSLEEAVNLVREYENSGRREHELVRCTMRLA